MTDCKKQKPKESTGKQEKVVLMWKDGTITETDMEVMHRYKAFYGEYPYNFKEKNK